MRIPTRVSLISDLRERDGYLCQFPGCDKEFTQDNPPTVDHWYPQSWCYENGWTPEEVWDLTNLKLMHKSCNAKKGNIVPNEDGTLTLKSRPQRVDKTLRAEPCNLCESGRLLLEGEICDLCGSGPQPASFPKYLQKQPKDCSHGYEENDHCWMCVTGLVERKSATLRLIEGP